MATISGWRKYALDYLGSQKPRRRELRIVILCLVSTGLILSILAILAGEPAFVGWWTRSFFILFFLLAGQHFLVVALLTLLKEHPMTGFWLLTTWTFLLTSRLI